MKCWDEYKNATTSCESCIAGYYSGTYGCTKCSPGCKICLGSQPSECYSCLNETNRIY